MNRYYHGAHRSGPYFEGWYLKCQTRDGQSLALIPALHIDASGQRSASLQVITGSRSWWLDLPAAEFQASKKEFAIRMGQNAFDSSRIQLCINRDGLALHGTLLHGPFVPLKSDIMGPFRFLAGMECAHGVISMGHPLSGTLTLNGEALDFDHGTCYIETDRGRSFPNAYLWTQCIFTQPQPESLMLSIATIPLPIGRFTGCICAIRSCGQEYRLATYRGARIRRWSGKCAVIEQGKYRLVVNVPQAQGHPLRAPIQGSMTRTIHESLCVSVRYRFWRGEELLFDRTDQRASFEYSENAP